VITAAISPYRGTRDDARGLVGEGFIEIFVDTPIEVCESRDVKGLYAKARRGEIKEFTGVSDPYEAPLNPELTLQTTDITPEENAQIIIDYLIKRGYVLPLSE
jgi:sulfate adenylyltransferase